MQMRFKPLDIFKKSFINVYYPSFVTCFDGDVKAKIRGFKRIFSMKI